MRYRLDRTQRIAQLRADAVERAKVLDDGAPQRLGQQWQLVEHRHLHWLQQHHRVHTGVGEREARIVPMMQQRAEERVRALERRQLLVDGAALLAQRVGELGPQRLDLRAVAPQCVLQYGVQQRRAVRGIVREPREVDLDGRQRQEARRGGERQCAGALRRHELGKHLVLELARQRHQPLRPLPQSTLDYGKQLAVHVRRCAGSRRGSGRGRGRRRRPAGERSARRGTKGS